LRSSCRGLNLRMSWFSLSEDSRSQTAGGIAGSRPQSRATVGGGIVALVAPATAVELARSDLQRLALYPFEFSGFALAGGYPVTWRPKLHAHCNPQRRKRDHDCEWVSAVRPPGGAGICVAGRTKKWFQVTRFPALPTAVMHGIEHRVESAGRFAVPLPQSCFLQPWDQSFPARRSLLPLSN